MDNTKKSDERKNAIRFVVKNAIQLGATMGTWLDTDFKFNNRAAHAALEAMLPPFVDEIIDRLEAVDLEKNGRCRQCGKEKE